MLSGWIVGKSASYFKASSCTLPLPRDPPSSNWCNYHMRILVAPDKFKGTLSAAEAAEAMALGILDCDTTAEVDICPIADGGEGSHEVMLAAGFDEVPVTVNSADGELHRSSIAVHGTTAVLELARLCGTPTLRQGPRPWTSHTGGLGEAILSAIRQGADEIVLCIGGSASVDGGSGLLNALGYEFRDAAGVLVQPGLAGLGTIFQVAAPDVPVGIPMTVVCDVSTPLLGQHGGIRLFSAQKGLDADEVLEAERRVAHWSQTTKRMLGRDLTDTPGGGSAGGVGFAAIAYLGAEFRQGLEYFDQLVDLSARIARSDLVITGEGMFDSGSLDGKTPVGVADRAIRAGRPCLLVAGRLEIDASRTLPFERCWSLSDEMGPARAMQDASDSLQTVTARAYQAWMNH